ncbi:Triple functional domain protein [Trichinella spiralis]|uniref:Triple functional domain protein n=1 Tax=Trichinella spiralis TaxID=6334 RepID=A0ABR3KWC9_TRISP
MSGNKAPIPDCPPPAYSPDPVGPPPVHTIPTVIAVTAPLGAEPVTVQIAGVDTLCHLSDFWILVRLLLDTVLHSFINGRRTSLPKLQSGHRSSPPYLNY